MAEPTLYLFDGYNLLKHRRLHGRTRARRRARELRRAEGARGVLVFDGAGSDERRGSLEIRYTAHADALLVVERVDDATRARLERLRRGTG